MREKLREYIDILFSRAALTVENAELKEEVLQNTLEHFDDLLREGRSEQEAYRAAVDAVGDLSGLIELEKPDFTKPLYERPAPVHPAYAPGRRVTEEEDADEMPYEPEAKAGKYRRRGVRGGIWLLALAAYFLLSFRTGAWHLTWVIFLIAPALCALASGTRTRGGAVAALWLGITAVYFLLSFATGLWHLTWIVFLIAAAATGLLCALLDYKEAKE